MRLNQLLPIVESRFLIECGGEIHKFLTDEELEAFNYKTVKSVWHSTIYNAIIIQLV